MKHYALEIYTVTAILLITLVAIFMPELTTIQKYVVFMSFLFVLHEWEEGRYPGGFLELLSANILQMEVEKETMLASRLITAVFIFVMTIVPFFYGDQITMFALTVATFCIFEGIIHIVGIILLHIGKPYSPGMVTAEIELVTGIALVIYIIKNHLGAWYDYTFAPFVFIACFAAMQRSLMAPLHLNYGTILGNVRRRFAGK
ncbi:MAG: HXXEE domain-containing protein [Bacteroidales bacterium]|nr:HXXEE domain-containing protein [Bacteroidales bacterium]